MKKRIWAMVAGLALSLCTMNAHAVEQEFCNTPLTAAIAGSASPASGNLQIFVDEQANTVRMRVTHNVAGATAIQLREGGAGQTGNVISSFGGATGIDVSYFLSDVERDAFIATLATANFYVIVASAAFPTPTGAIRADGVICFVTPEGEAEVPEGEIPEGLVDYECNVSLTGGQVVPASGTSATGTVNMSFESANQATIILFHSVPVNDIGDLMIYKGSPGEVGTPVRRIAAGLPQVLLTVTKAELEDYTSEPHYIQVESLSGNNTIRGDIVGCAFSDGVEEGEGIVEEGEGQGEPVDCLIFEDPNPANLKCSVDLSGSSVVPPTSSSFSGGVQITGPFEPDGQYFLVVRHNVPSPTSISLFKGAPGQQGELFLSFTSGLACPFVQFLSPNFFQVLGNNPLYVEIATSGDTNATIRGDLVCPDAVDGEPEGEGQGAADGEGVIDGEGSGGSDLASIADGLLFVFHTADGSQNGLLEFAEATFAAPIMTEEQFLALDDNDDQALSTGELHRYAGPVRKHNADINGNFILDVSELLRLIQFYNAGAYSCVEPAGSTEDGFEPGSAGKGGVACQRHAADYIGGGDFNIDLSELLRVIQLFNFGTYAYCETPSTADDNYCIAGELQFP